jgi:hypothetical protein
LKNRNSIGCPFIHGCGGGGPMVDYKRLSDEDLSLAIDRAQAAIEGQCLIIAQIAATAACFQDSAEHRQIEETTSR